MTPASRSFTLLPLLAVACVSVAMAKPYVPLDDTVVLERLPQQRDAAVVDLTRLRQALAARPRDVNLATEYARRAIAASRSSGDPRFLGQAQGALASWWNDPEVPVAIAVLRATIRQSLHEFPAALDDLDRVLVRVPRDGQARLTRATIRTVVGQYRDAEADCAALSALAAPIVSITCRASIASVDGRAATAYAELAAAMGAETRAPASIRNWTHTLAAEIAGRLGDATAAEAHFRAAVAADPQDAYARGAYADFLLERQRPREAAALVDGDLANDALLLRLALAEACFPERSPAEQSAYATHVGMLRDRFAASRARGDVVHRREEARFVLHLEQDAARALVLARANWQVQREPADLRILAEAAVATRDAGALATVRAWQQEHALEDVVLANLMGAGS